MHCYLYLYIYIYIFVYIYAGVERHILHVIFIYIYIYDVHTHHLQVHILHVICIYAYIREGEATSHSSKQDLRCGEVVYPVMCADAVTRGVPCRAAGGWLLLPLLPDPNLADYYSHVPEIIKKITDDLKAAGCWVADPSSGVKVSAPGLGVEVSNMHILETSWHRWTPIRAPLPLGTSTKWQELLKTHEFTFTEDKGILWNPESWCWEGSPTWYISGVSSQRTAQALLVELLIRC